MSVEPAFLRRLAQVAAAETLPRFRASGAIDNKLSSGFDPVTEADREAERALRAAIADRFPEHGILGEEFGLEREESSQRWVIDPVDGTRAFISGLPLWGTLVGLIDQGIATTGMMSQPFTGEFFYATPKGAFYEGPGGGRRLATRETSTVEEATLCTTTPALFKDEQKTAYERVESRVQLARYGTDCYAYAMLAAGHVDLVIENGLNAYDIVALIPLIEQAGGVVTTWDGERAEGGGDIVAAATPALHRQALSLLKGL